jgi:hypothetical protein
MSKKMLLIASLIACISGSSFAANDDLTTSTSEIKGNPIGRQDDYTINSKDTGKVKIQCHFTNSGKTTAVLHIWGSPNQQKSKSTISLSRGSKEHPSSVDYSEVLTLKPRWWCKIYTPKGKESSKYCAYFSVSDATLSYYKPFATWNKTTHSEDTQYSCRIVGGVKASFFHFK